MKVKNKNNQPKAINQKQQQQKHTSLITNYLLKTEQAMENK